MRLRTIRNCRVEAAQVLGLAITLACAGGAVAGAQTAGPLLVISQPAADTPKEAYIDLAPHIEPALRDGGKIDAFVFRADLPAIKALLDSKTLQPQDLKSPLSKASARKIAQALGARYILTVSAHSTKDGLVATADTEVNLTQDQWTTLSNDRLLPPRRKGKQLSLLESVHAMVSGLVQKVQSAVMRGPVAGGPKPGVPQVTDGTPVRDRIVSNAKAQASDQHKDKGDVPDPVVPTGPRNPAGGNPAADTGRGTPAQGTGSPSARQSNIPSTYELLIDKARRNGDTANLLIALRRAVTDKPHDIRLRRDLIKAYNDRGWNDMARDEAGRAVEMAPRDAGVHHLLGDSLLIVGEAEAALKEFQTAVSLAPGDASAYVSLGDAYAGLGKPDESMKAYQDAAKADPKSPAPSRRLARLYGLSGKYAECVAALTVARSLTPAEDMASFREDQSSLLSGLESILTETLSRLALARKSFVGGTKNREETHRDVTAQRKRGEEIASLLEQMPDVGFNRVQALYAQAAALVAQSAEKYLDFLESQNTAEDEESSLMRIEAGKQLADASKNLKAQLAPKK